MDERSEIFHGERKLVRIDSDNPILTGVPAAVAGSRVPLPRAHLASFERHAAAALAFEEARMRRFQLRGALGHSALELLVDLLELAGRPVGLCNDLDFGAQH